MKIFSATLKGTTTVSQGTTNLSGSFTGSFSGSLAGIAGDVSDYSSSVALRTTTLEAASGSFSTRTTNIERVYATTGSNTFTGAQIIQGTLTAQTLVVQTVTSSVLFTTGSNKLGSLLSNVQELTGSVGITGSLAVNGTTAIVGSGTANYVPKFTSTGTIGDSLIFDNGTNLGIGTTTLSASSNYRALNINGTTGSEIYLKGSNVDYGYIYANSSNVIVATQTAIPLLLQTNNLTRLTISSTGEATFSSSVTVAGEFFLRWGLDNSGVNSRVWGIRNGWSTGGDLAFITSSTNNTTLDTTRLTINRDGNVGIGTSSPSQKLEVIGTTKLSSAAGNITGINITPGSVTNTYQTIGESTAPGGVVRFHAGIVTGWANWENYGASYMDFKVEIKGSGTSDTSYTAMQIRPTGDIRMYSLVGSGTRTVVADANGQLSAPVSDETVKENIRPIGYGVKEIMQMNPVWFEFKDEFKDYGTGRQNGNIAQELEKIIPEAVFLTPQTNKKGIEYGQLHAVYIKAIQEQQAQIDELKAKLQ
jgi:hypothetical protein